MIQSILLSIKTACGWLSPRARTILIACVLAFPVTLFLGQVSSEVIVGWLAERTADWPYWVIDWLTNAFVLAVLLLLFFDRRKEIDASPTTPQSATYRLLDDVALHGEQPDELGLDNFVARLARTVVLPVGGNSLVIGLEAPWGSGKSSVLDLLCRRLCVDQEKPIVVRFNPWMASGSDGVSRAFFSQFSGSLRNADEQELAKKLVTYGEMLEELMPPPARVLPRLGIQHLRRIAGRIPELDIQGEWDQLSDSVRKINKPVVVIIDDIDRLEPEDVVTVFQLVKVVASFPRVAYVLAFDPKPVDAALQQGGMYEMGREYRDKIVQANIPLPRIPYPARKRFLQTRLEQRIEAWKFDLSDAERRLLAEAVPLVLTALKTPRDIKRVLNKTLIAAEVLRNEVNFADVLVFESTHAMFPSVIDLIRHRPEVVNAGDHEAEIGYEASMTALLAERLQSNKRGKDDRLADFTRMYPGREGELAPLLMCLFGPFFDRDADKPPPADLRVSDPSTLRKLLYQEVVGELSAATANQFLCEIDSRAPQLAEAVETNSLPGLFAHVRQYAASIEVPAPLQLLRQVAEAVNQQFMRWKSDSSDDAGWLATAVLSSVKEDDVRWMVLETLIADRELIATTEPVLVTLLRDVGLWKEGTYLGLENLSGSARHEVAWLQVDKLDHLRKTWVVAAESHGVREILTRFPNAGGVLFRLQQLLDRPDELLQALQRAFEEPDIAASFISLFPPGIGLNGVKKLLTPESIKLLQSALSHPSIDERTAERFGEYLERDTDSEMAE